MGRDPTPVRDASSTYYRPDRPVLTRGNDRTIVNSVFTRIANDCASIKIIHAYVDSNGNYTGEVNSPLNYCFKYEANIDQSSRDFMLDVYLTLLDKGEIAIVPTDTDVSLLDDRAFDVETMRVGTIVKWWPTHVLIRVYNEKTGKYEEVPFPKTGVSIIENPFYSTMNAPNSIAQRLMRKLTLLDVVDEQTSSGKLDLIIQLPYTIRSEARRKDAERRRKDIVDQLSGPTGSKYGIAYTDATEHVTQLNRSLENNLLKQIEYLTSMLYSQLGITQELLANTATEQEQLTYTQKVCIPIVSTVTAELRRKFLSKTARTKGQDIVFFNEPFKYIPTSQLSDILDKLRRDEILSADEVRALIGFRPTGDAQANKLQNPNLSASPDAPPPAMTGEFVDQTPPQQTTRGENQNAGSSIDK
jgi:hypothetical protein